MTALMLSQILTEQVMRYGNCQVLIHEKGPINTVTMKVEKGEIVFVISKEPTIDADQTKIDTRTYGAQISENRATVSLRAKFSGRILEAIRRK